MCTSRTFAGTLGAGMLLVIWLTALSDELHAQARHVPLGHVVISAGLRTEGVRPYQSLELVVTVQNRGRDSTYLEVPADRPVVVRLYRPGRPGGNLVWDGTNQLFFGMSRRLALGPGKHTSFVTRERLTALLGDSLPSGTYQIAALLRVSGGYVEIPLGDRNLQLTTER